MPLETPIYISDLVATNPPSTDPKSEGAAHLRNLKSALKTTFPGITGAVTATQLELNQLAGSTSAIQAQLNSKAPLASPTFTGAATLPAATTIGAVTAAEVLRLSGVTSPIQTQINTKAPIASPVFTGVVNLPPTGFGVTEAVTKGYADGLAFAAALPAQAGNANKIITTNGVTASWQTNRAVLPITIVTATTQTAVDGNHYVMSNSALSTLTLPASPINGIGIDVTFANSRIDNIIAANGSGLMVSDAGVPIFEDLVYDVPSVTLSLVYAGNAWRFKAQGSSIAITETVETTALALRNATETAALLVRNATEAAALLARGYEVPVAYATGISLTRATQTVSQSGVVYAPVPGSVPFTTSGTFETASFRVIQGVMGSDLAAGTGAGLVGFSPTGLGAVPGTVQNALNTFNQKPTGQFYSELGAKIQRVADRLFVGDAVAHDGKNTPTVSTWVSSMSGGIYEYLERAATLVAPAYKAGIGIFGAGRSSTGSGGVNDASIGVAGFAYNDFSAGAAGVWALYGTSLRKSGTNGATHGIEVDIGNAGSLVQLFPSAMFVAGQTHGAWICSGGESANTPGLVGVASVAIGIISNDPAKVARFDKGIVFENRSISGTDGVTGNGIAIALAARHQQMWFNNSNQVVGELVTNAVTATNALRLDISDFGLLVQDRTTGATQFQVQNTPSAANYLTVVAGATPQMVANGSGANLDIQLTTKGTGLLKTSYGSAAATTPASFVASRSLSIKDGNGITYFIPLSTTAW